MTTQSNNPSAPSSPALLDFSQANTQTLSKLCGQFDRHLLQIEQRLDIQIIRRGSNFSFDGEQANIDTAIAILNSLLEEIEQGLEVTPDSVHLTIQQFSGADDEAHETNDTSLTHIKTKKGTIKPRGHNQQIYVHAVLTNDINFGIGPAGTGKTYLAVACAVQAILNDEVERILLVRPAVEAGEKLGFLPGDLSQKVDPYLRPLYDALYEMFGFETVDKLIERNIIEVAPLAYMRGRTLNNAFIILDESQNTTREQMKMFLTRIGFGSTAVINGDPSQIDLPRGQASGLSHAINVLEGVKGISFTYFTSKDVVRHPLVQRIVDAYDKADKKENQ